ncbi:MAG: hypothetical protein FWH11_13445 [Micrococcales bacterium]|nr:hypothetical protein [Micrococcales bacterium]
MDAVPSDKDIEYAIKRLRFAAVDAFMCGPWGPGKRGGGGLFDWYEDKNSTSTGYYHLRDAEKIPDGGTKFFGYTRPNSEGRYGGKAIDHNLEVMNDPSTRIPEGFARSRAGSKRSSTAGGTFQTRARSRAGRKSWIRSSIVLDGDRI